MKIKNILLVIGLFLEASTSLASPNSTSAEEEQCILENIKKWERNSNSNSDWVPSGPTGEDIKAATKIENQAVKESREDKFIETVKNGNIKNVEALIALGVNLEVRDNENMTALMIAAKDGHTNIVSTLINAGAHLGARGRCGETALFYASDNAHAETVKALMAHGAAQNEKDLGSLFMSAVFRGYSETAKAFMVDCASIDNNTLYQAYLTAQRTCSPEIVNAIANLYNNR
jgi:ankyrin repeat protein